MSSRGAIHLKYTHSITIVTLKAAKIFVGDAVNWEKLLFVIPIVVWSND